MEGVMVLSALGTVGERSLPSGHAPVRLTVQTLHKRPAEHPVIRHWLTHHTLFANALK